MRKSCLLLLVLGLLVSCGSAKVNYKNPQSITLSFYKAISSYNLEQAKLMVTEETVPLITLMQTLADALSEEEKSAEEEKNAALLKLLKKAKCTIDGDAAQCSVCCNESGAFETEVIKLKKVDKKWLVDMPKEDLK